MLHIILISTVLLVCQGAELPIYGNLNSESTRWGNDNFVVLDHGVRKVIEGIVYYCEGKPTEGALVEVYLDESANVRKWEYSKKRIAVCKTQSNGRFKFDSIPVGKYEVRCSLEGYQTYSFIRVTIVSSAKTIKNRELKAYMFAAW